MNTFATIFITDIVFVRSRCVELVLFCCVGTIVFLFLFLDTFFVVSMFFRRLEFQHILEGGGGAKM